MPVASCAPSYGVFFFFERCFPRLPRGPFLRRCTRTYAACTLYSTSSPSSIQHPGPAGSWSNLINMGALLVMWWTIKNRLYYVFHPTESLFSSSKKSKTSPLFGRSRIRINPHVLVWVGVELKLNFTTIHSNTCGLRWIRQHPNKAFKISCHIESYGTCMKH